ncbi:MAG: coenzyme F420-0:L-glutamate ligase [Candidatus Hodarchaeales archaeon]|jgi:coenzyme F420-0:L-glutamate ligase
MKIEYFGITTRIIQPKENLISIFLGSLEASESFPLQDGDIIAIASKVVAMEQNRLVDLEHQQPSSRANKLASMTNLPAEFIELVLEEADEVIGTVYGALLTLRNNILQANAGVDKSNAGKNKAILLPKDPNGYAANFKRQIEDKLNVKNLGVLIVDSCTRPLRRGTLGMGLGSAGFPAAVDERGLLDLFGYKMEITYRAIADNLASACNLLMGESSELIPFVIVRGVPIRKFGWDKLKETDPIIPPDQCLFFKNFQTKRY